jgi:predicted kinase
MKPFLLQMAGMPGSGKSTLAQAVARETGAIVLDKDVFHTAVLRSGIEKEGSGGIAYEVLFDLAADIAKYGHSIVVDSAAFFPIILAKGQSIADKNGMTYKVIECVCPKEQLPMRLASRDARSSQWTVLLEIDMERRPGAEPLTGPHLTVDTTRSVDTILVEALEYIRR